MSKLKKIVDYNKLHGPIKTTSWLVNNVKYRASKLASKPIEFEREIISLNDESLLPKTKEKIFIFASVAYYDVGGGQRSAQLAKIFNKLGYSVYYIFAFDSSESKKIKMDIPCCMHMHIKNVNVSKIENLISFNDIAIFEAPCTKFKKYLKILRDKKAKIIYENIDNWESSLGNEVFDADTLKEMLEYSTILTATAKPLVDQLKSYLDRYGIEKKKIVYLPNAVDDELFDINKTYSKPQDLIIGKKTLLYYGSLWGEWFDWDLVYELAIKNPEIEINLIGDTSALDKGKRKIKNIHFLGIKNQQDLPSYLFYTDYAILPFKVDNIGKYVSPLKIFEYIAMNKKIISTPLPDILGYPNLYVGSNASEWKKVLNSKKKVNETMARNFIEENNWYSRCIKLLESLSQKGIKKCPSKYYNNISVIVLNYNNDKVIFRCVDSLKKFNDRYNYEIIVVDNQSSDGSYEKMLKTYKSDKNIKIIQNSKNGCSSGRNLGISNASNEYILFLDSDQWVLHKYWLDNYLELFTDLSNIGAVAWNAGWFNEYGLSYRYVDNYDFRAMMPNVRARSDVGYLATCGFLTKKQILEQVEGFDEAYDPTCYEDTDLTLKIRNEGYQIYYCSYLGVGHLPHQTTKAGSKKHDELILEKGNYFVKKWKSINSELLKYKK